MVKKSGVKRSRTSENSEQPAPQPFRSTPPPKVPNFRNPPLWVTNDLYMSGTHSPLASGGRKSPNSLYDGLPRPFAKPVRRPSKAVEPENEAVQTVQTPMSLLMGESGCRLAKYAQRAFGRASDVALLHRFRDRNRPTLFRPRRVPSDAASFVRVCSWGPCLTARASSRGSVGVVSCAPCVAEDLSHHTSKLVGVGWGAGWWKCPNLDTLGKIEMAKLPRTFFVRRTVRGTEETT